MGVQTSAYLPSLRFGSVDRFNEYSCLAWLAPGTVTAIDLHMNKLATILFSSSLGLGACAWQDQDVTDGSSHGLAASQHPSATMALLPTAQQQQLRAVGVVDVELNERSVPWLMRFAPGAVATASVLPKIASLYSMDVNDLVPRSSDIDELGLQHHRYTQIHNGLLAVGSELVVHEDEFGNVASVVSTLVQGATATQATMVASDLLVLAKANYLHLKDVTAVAGPLVYVVKEGVMHLAHTITVSGISPSQPVRDRIYVDATTGAYITTHPQIHTARVRETYDAKSTETKGTLVLSENQATSPDTVITKIHTNTGRAYDCFKQFFSRDSYNGQGATIVATGHYGVQMNNAFWSPDAQQLAFGDGDGQIFGPLVDFDIASHELAHAVTSSTSNMTYEKESGALNEAMSDIAAMMCQAKLSGGVSDATWLLGEESWTPNKAGDALRYADKPSKDGFSKDHVSQMPACGTPTENNDWCGVHSNSGIANLAFKLLVTGGTHPSVASAVQVPKLGMDRSAAITFRAWTQHMTPSSTFAQTRAAFKQAATELYPTETATIAATELAWYAVGAGPAVGNLPTGVEDPNKLADQPQDPSNPDPSNPSDPNNPGAGSQPQLIEGSCSSSTAPSGPTVLMLLAMFGLVAKRRRAS
jgi:MYXO-CTERM domain-containing protein